MQSNPVCENAIGAMLHEFRHNNWMVKEHWPLIESHVRLILADALKHVPPAPQVKILDIGCFNGFVGLIFRELGYEVMGVDMYETSEQQELFARHGMEFLKVNLNDLHPFAKLQANSFDLVIIAQVIEHVLNHPLGLMQDVARVMRPGAWLALTTPNPANLMGAIRLLQSKPLLWGSQDFIELPKINAGEIISEAEIHYHEYLQPELHSLMTKAGLSVAQLRYLGLGVTPNQPILKRWVKSRSLTQYLMSKRLFASNHYCLAHKPLPTSLTANGLTHKEE